MSDLIQRLTQTNQFHENADVTTKEVVDTLEKQQAEIESLRSQVRIEQLYVQDLAADAGRYRWLRENHAWWLLKHFPANKPYLDAVEVIDAAIDNAMKESQQ